MEKTKQSAGFSGTTSDISPAGTGWVFIPNDLDRDAYVAQCLNQKTVSIKTDRGAYYHHVRIAESDLNEVVFPEDKSVMGSLVAWVALPKYNVPFVVSVISLTEAFGKINQEGQFRLLKRSPDAVVDVDGKALKGKLDISVASQTDGVGEINMSVTNPDDSAIMRLFVKGMVDIHASKQVRIAFQEELNIELLDEELTPIANISYKLDEGFTLLDEFENTFTTRDGEIALGNANSGTEEPMVMGDTLKSMLEDILDKITQLTVPTAFGPSGTPVNAADFVAISQQLGDILSDLCNLDKS